MKEKVKLIIIKRMEKSIMPYWLEDNGRYIQRKIKNIRRRIFMNVGRKINLIELGRKGEK